MTVETKPTESKALAVFHEMREVLAPFPISDFLHLVPTTFQERSDLFRPSATVVRVNPDDPRDVYDTPGSKGATVCLHSQALERIANAAGIDFDPTLTRHTHDRVNEPFICEMHVGGWYIDSLGQRRLITAGAVSDLRDGSVTAKVLGGGVNTARQFVCERTESRARNRAIRKTTNLPSSFKRDELRKPMVAVRFRLDERDPDVRRALIERGTGAAREVFGDTKTQAIDAGVARPEEEIIEGQVAEQASQTVDEEPEIPAEAAATTQADIDAIAGAAAAAVAKRPETERSTVVDDELLAIVGTKLRDALALEPRVSRSRWPLVRLAVLRGLFPAVTKSKLANVAQARVVIDLASKKAPEIERLYAWLLEKDPTLADVAAEIAKPEQQTLAGGAA